MAKISLQAKREGGNRHTAPAAMRQGKGRAKSAPQAALGDSNLQSQAVTVEIANTAFGGLRNPQQCLCSPITAPQRR